MIWAEPTRETNFWATTFVLLDYGPLFFVKLENNTTARKEIKF